MVGADEEKSEKSDDWSLDVGTISVDGHRERTYVILSTRAMVAHQWVVDLCVGEAEIEMEDLDC